MKTHVQWVGGQHFKHLISELRSLIVNHIKIESLYPFCIKFKIMAAKEFTIEGT